MKIHIVQKNDTLWKIAQRYGVTLEELKAANTQLSNPDMLMPGMKIRIPTTGGTVKKESPVKEQPIQKEVPKTIQPFKQEKPYTEPVQKEIMKEVPKPIYIPQPPQPKPVIPEVDINNYYMLNMAKIDVDVPKKEKPIMKEKPKEKPIKKEEPIKEEPVKEMPQQPLYVEKPCPPYPCPPIQYPCIPCVPMGPVMPGSGLPHFYPMPAMQQQMMPMQQQMMPMMYQPWQANPYQQFMGMDPMMQGSFQQEQMDGESMLNPDDFDTVELTPMTPVQGVGDEGGDQWDGTDSDWSMGTNPMMMGQGYPMQGMDPMMWQGTQMQGMDPMMWQGSQMQGMDPMMWQGSQMQGMDPSMMGQGSPMQGMDPMMWQGYPMQDMGQMMQQSQQHPEILTKDCGCGGQSSQGYSMPQAGFQQPGYPMGQGMMGYYPMVPQQAGFQGYPMFDQQQFMPNWQGGFPQQGQFGQMPGFDQQQQFGAQSGFDPNAFPPGGGFPLPSTLDDDDEE